MAFRLGLLAMLGLLATLGGQAVVPSAVAAASGTRHAASHPADPMDADDLALLRANGDKVTGNTIVNDCGTPVRPLVSHPAADVGVVVEADPTGLCSGSTLPSSIAVMLRAGSGWRISASAPGTDYRLGPMHGGHPDILVAVPGSRGCPILGYTGRTYTMTKSCLQ